MHSDRLVPQPFPARRGVFQVVAPAGRIEIHSIDSRGVEYMALELPEQDFNEELVELLWDLLDVGDPVMVLRLERED
jgi:hypothetical protein